MDEKEVQLEVKESELDLVGKCAACYSRVSDNRKIVYKLFRTQCLIDIVCHFKLEVLIYLLPFIFFFKANQLVVWKNDDIFIFVKQQTPLTENQFYIRSTAHLQSVMGSDDAFLKRLMVYQRELSKAFAVYGRKLIFAEHFRQYSSKSREHFDLGVFPFHEAQFDALKPFFDSAFRFYRGDIDCKNIIRFEGQADFLSKKQRVSITANELACWSKTVEPKAMSFELSVTLLFRDFRNFNWLFSSYSRLLVRKSTFLSPSKMKGSFF